MKVLGPRREERERERETEREREISIIRESMKYNIDFHDWLTVIRAFE